jgi:threonine/homoserine/homoserine lactone efflux protein
LRSFRVVRLRHFGTLASEQPSEVPLHDALALLIFLFPLAYSPGPGNMVFAAAGARFGLRATLRASLGYHLATWIVTAGIGLGLIGLAAGAPEAASVMKAAGAAYILWLAWRLARAGRGGALWEAPPIGFAGGAALLLLNPKAYLIIALMFSQFLPAEAPDRAGAVAWIATAFTLNNLIAFTAWTLVGDRLARVFRSEGSARRVNLGFGAMLAGTAVWMVLA